MKYLLRSIVGILCILLFPRLSSAQGPTSTAIVDAFTLQELLAAFFYVPGELERILLIGQVPEDVQAEVPLPPGARIIGSLNTPDNSIIVTVVHGVESAVYANYTSLLKMSGWKMPQSMTQRGGFQPPVMQQITGYCNAKDSFLSIRISQRPDHTSRVVVSLQRAQGSGIGICRSPSPMTPGQPEEGPMPTLVIPEDAKNVGSGGCGASMGERVDSNRLETALSVRDLLRHFAEQLPSQGWKLTEEATSVSIALQTWLSADEKGQRWQGVLSVMTLGTDASTREVSFRVLRAS